MTKKAIITGVGGQDGILLSDLLLKEGYDVVGICRPSKEIIYTGAIQHLKNIKIIKLDIADKNQVDQLIKAEKPSQLYHLAVCHHESTLNRHVDTELDSRMLKTNFRSTENFIHAILNNFKDCRFFYAGSSQMYTATKKSEIVNEKTPFNPSSFYGHTKHWSQQLIDYYRKNNNFWGVTGVLFNHESIYRDEKYISRLITRSAAKIKLGDKKEIKVKNPFSRADWGSAKDFTQAFFKMLNADTPEDYIVSSGIEHSVSDIINIAFDSLNLDISKFLLYPNNAKEPELSILGDSSKLSKKLNWEQKEEFKSLILNMVGHDLNLLKN